jgi:hypothetical protein
MNHDEDLDDFNAHIRNAEHSIHRVAIRAEALDDGFAMSQTISAQEALVKAKKLIHSVYESRKRPSSIFC